MKLNIGKVILLVGIVFFLFKKVLKLFFLDIYLFVGYSIAFAIVLVVLNHFLSQKYLEQLKSYVAVRPSNVHMAAAIVAAINFLGIWLVSFGLKVYDIMVIGNDNYTYFIDQGSFRSIFNFTLLLSILLFIYFDITFNSLSKDQQIEEQRVITGSVSAQFESLKNQLDPHFLFNSLNVLNALIEENPDKAQEFTNSLSKTYRYILEQKNKELVPLEEELDFARTYVELLQMRFEDSIVFKIPETTKQEGAKVVPLSLQLLLENVIKHNKVSSTKPVHIVITEESKGYLTIVNNLNKKTQTDDRRGIGLQNIIERYGLLTNKPIVIEETETTFKVKIPILTKKIEHMRILDVQENEQEVLIEAKKKVERIKKFYAHLTSYIMVNLFLIILNVMTNSHFMWSLIVVFSWGIGLAADYMKTYNYNLFLGKDWEDRKIREHMEKHKKENNNQWN
ncbi:MAG: 2TM domain-containing protein [Flavobacteriaceae bacterium]|jgi:hypothetical protein|nr:2TM domain-containing protein [Flavobacteriaceae bacterium]